MNGIHDGHRKRIREQFMEEGFSENTPPHKVLELLLFYSIPRRDTNELAHKLIERFGSVAGVLDAPEEQLLKIEGISENTVCLLKLIMPVARSYINDKEKTGRQIYTLGNAADYLFNKFMGLTVETVYLLCLDNRLRILDCPMLSQGDEISVSVSTRMVAEQVFKTKATSVMLGHNHPKGFAFPSAADVKVTTDIATALTHLGINFLDHIIVADGEYVSMAQSRDYGFIFEQYQP